MSRKLPRPGTTASHDIVQRLRAMGHPGLTLFSSGSTGKSKAAVHDFVPMLEKYKVRGTLSDNYVPVVRSHWRCQYAAVQPVQRRLRDYRADRRPETVCKAIQDYQGRIVADVPDVPEPVLVSEAHEKYDMSSLKTVTYGTEVMPESTLARFTALFPDVRMLQTYGLSEVGILRSKSKSSDSLWVKVGGEGFETRIVDGLLEIKAKSAMLGYLNAPSPFTEDGWFMTGDAVEVDGEYIRILGRKSEIINVGGEKVYPAEVESVLQTMDGVEEVVVFSEPHPLTGNIVVAKVKLSSGEDLSAFRKRMRSYCSDKLSRFMIPQKVLIVEQELHGERFKKMRRA